MEKDKKAYIDLDVWKEERALANDIYVATKFFPKDVARGSIYELETQLYIYFDQKYIEELTLKSTTEIRNH